jgi:ribosomal protein L11 methyltransferase
MEADGPDRILLRTLVPGTSKQRLARIEVGVKLVSILEPLGELRIRDLDDDEDWQESWKSHFDLLKVGRRLVIKPTWIEHKPEAGEIVIEINPGMAFGTGYHPTTHTCLEAMEHFVQPGMSVLDVGTGSGILAITAVKLGAARVVAMDIDPEAIRAARQNFRRTRTAKQVGLTQGSVPHPLAGPEQFDLAVANISARAVCDRGSFILSTLRPQGILIASGLLKTQRHEVMRVLEPLGCTLIRQWSQDDWASLAFRRGIGQP